MYSGLFQFLSGVALALLATSIWGRFKLRRRYLAYVAVGILAYFLLFYFVRLGYENRGTLLGLAPFLGSLLLTLGWVVSNEISLYNARKQHTIKLLTDYMFTSTRIEDRKLIKAKLSSYKNKLTPEVVEFTSEADEFLQAVDRELNFFEFLAIGLDTGDLDPDVAKKSLLHLFCAFYEQTEAYVDYWHEEAPGTWIYLRRMYPKWRVERDAERSSVQAEDGAGRRARREPTGRHPDRPPDAA